MSLFRTSTLLFGGVEFLGSTMHKYCQSVSGVQVNKISARYNDDAESTMASSGKCSSVSEEILITDLPHYRIRQKMNEAIDGWVRGENILKEVYKRTANTALDLLNQEEIKGTILVVADEEDLKRYAAEEYLRDVNNTTDELYSTRQMRGMRIWSPEFENFLLRYSDGSTYWSDSNRPGMRGRLCSKDGAVFFSSAGLAKGAALPITWHYGRQPGAKHWPGTSCRHEAAVCAAAYLNKGFVFLKNSSGSIYVFIARRRDDIDSFDCYEQKEGELNFEFFFNF